MPSIKLTPQVLSTLPATGGRRTDYFDEVRRGLVLRVSANSRSWAVTWKRRGRRERVTLGELNLFTLAEAREEARQVLIRVSRGQNPAAERREALRRGPAAPDALTIGELVAKALARLSVRPSTRREWVRLVEIEIKPGLGTVPAEASGPEEMRTLRRRIRTWSDAIIDRGAPRTASHAWAVLRRCYSWAVPELIAISPFPGFRPPPLGDPSTRVLDEDELRALLESLEALPGRQSDAAQLLLLTGVRKAMVLGMKRSELQQLEGREPRWVVPGGFVGRSKSGRDHVVPLSEPAVAILRRLLPLAPGELVFPGVGHADRPMAICSRHARTLREGVAERLAPRPIAPWTLHGFRHTLATHMREDLHVSRDVVSAILGHTQAGPAATRIYDRAELLPERRAALVAWASWLERIQQPRGQRPADVLPMAI